MEEPPPEEPVEDMEAEAPVEEAGPEPDNEMGEGEDPPADDMMDDDMD